MKKNRIIAIFTVLAIVLTVATCYVIYSYLEPKRQTVYVFNDNYARGTQITDDILTPIKVDDKIMVANNESNIEDQFVTPKDYAEIRKGQYLRMDVALGMPLTFAMTSGNDSAVANSMQSTSVAVTIPVNGVTGVTNELTPESRVNVYCALEDSVHLILQNMKVLSVFYSDASISAVSLETTVEESLKLIYAENYGSIYLGLIDGTGYQAVDEEEMLYFSLADQGTDFSGSGDDGYSSYIGLLDDELGENMDDVEDDDEDEDEDEVETEFVWNSADESVTDDVQAEEESEEAPALIPAGGEEQGAVMPDVG